MEAVFEGEKQRLSENNSTLSCIVPVFVSLRQYLEVSCWVSQSWVVVHYEEFAIGIPELESIKEPMALVSNSLDRKNGYIIGASLIRMDDSGCCPLENELSVSISWPRPVMVPVTTACVGTFP